MAIASVHITLLDGSSWEVQPEGYNADAASHEVVHALWRRIDNTGVVPLKPLVVRDHHNGGAWVVAHFGPNAVAAILADDPAAV